PLDGQRDNEIAKPGRKPAAGMRAHVTTVIASDLSAEARRAKAEAKQSSFAAARKLDCFRLRAKRFGGLPARRSLRSKRRRVVAFAPRNDGRGTVAPITPPQEP